METGNWNKGYELSDAEKDKVKKAIRRHQVFWSIVCIGYIVFCSYWAIQVAVRYHSFYFLTSLIFAAICYGYISKADNMLTEKIEADAFSWKNDIVTGKILGGRYSRSRLKTASGCVIHPGFCLFKKGEEIILIEYENVTKNAIENMVLLYNPKAYSIR